MPGRAPVLPLLVTAILAARAYGLDILDGPFNDLANAEGFAQECAQARDLGFDGKTLIHPNQIAPCNAAFTPSADEIAQARAIIAAFDLPENHEQGRHRARRPHGRAAARRHGAAHGGDRRRGRGTRVVIECAFDGAALSLSPRSGEVGATTETSSRLRGRSGGTIRTAAS